MIRILMLDLGGTLINQDNQVFPHVLEALETVQGFRTDVQDPLLICLISDFFMPTPERTEQNIFQEYVSLLESLNLLRFFEPVERHVTLSTHAGVFKPDPRIFELAIERLDHTAGFNECIFITENADHIEACRSLGMKTLHFSENESEADFNDWSEAPLLIAQIVNPENINNLEKALRLRLSVEHDLEFIAINEKSADGTVRGRVKQWHAVPTLKLGTRRNPQVTFSEGVEIDMSPQGRILAVKTEHPGQEEIEEAAHYIKTLEDNKQIKRNGGSLSSGETHRETVNEKGEKRIKRERFSSI